MTNKTNKTTKAGKTAEQRDLKVASNILYHLIFAQAGSVGKAIAELVMNSQDAGADTFSLTIDTKGFVAEDNGRGFQTRKEIEDWFEELGFEHTSDLHQQDGRFSRFGLGRAQIQAFATTEWHTTTFKMAVDIKGKGLGYDLYVDQPHHQGCRIEGAWYEPLSLMELKEITAEIEALIAYTKIAVLINGVTVNQKSIKWDLETDQVFIKRRETGDLSVYNQGVLVRQYPSYQYGSGIVVSKVPFALNMARTDILTSTCPVWKQVSAFLRSDAAKRSKSKPRLTDAERTLLLNQWLAGELRYFDVEKSPLLEDIVCRKVTLKRLTRGTVTIKTKECGNQQADKLQQAKLALVLHESIVQQLGANSPEQAIDILSATLKRDRSYGKINYVPIQNMVESMSDHYQLLKTNELTKVELMGIKTLNKGISYLSSAVNLAYGYQIGSTQRQMPRKLYVGVSTGANAWTDGSSYIAVEREFLRKHIRDGFRGLTVLANVLVHELCHDSNSATSHDHGTEFFQIFHDVLCSQHSNEYGTAIRSMGSYLIQYAKKNGIKLGKAELGDFDREITFERELLGSEKFAEETEAMESEAA